jgi:hypothetical protein
MKRLRGKAEAEAERRARAKVAKEVAEIKAADDVIVEIAQQLPGRIRAKIAKVRCKLSAQIMQLDPTTKGRSGGPVSGDGDRRRRLSMRCVRTFHKKESLHLQKVNRNFFSRL